MNKFPFGVAHFFHEMLINLLWFNTCTVKNGTIRELLTNLNKDLAGGSGWSTDLMLPSV